MSDSLIWTLLGHLVCIAQWAAFILVDYAYLGRGRRFRHPCVWAALLALAVLTLSVLCGFGFFNIKSVVSNIIYLLVIALLFGGTAVDRMSACIINGILCLLTENTVSFVFARLHGICPGEVWRYRTCLAALVISILLVGILVARFLCRWNHCSALDPLQALLMSFFPGVVVLLNIFIMISSNRRVPTLLDLMLTVGLTIAVLVHLAIVQMFNDQVVQGQASHFQAALEQQRAEALMESYTAQRRLTHEFTNHIAALDALLRQGDLTGAQEYLSSVSKVVAAGTTILDTHNPLLDSLLSRKYEEAAQQGVELYFDLCDLKDLPFCGTDLGHRHLQPAGQCHPGGGAGQTAGGVPAGAQERGRIPHLGAQPGAEGPGAGGWGAAAFHQGRAGPWHGPCQRAGGAGPLPLRVHAQLSGPLVPLYLCGAYPQVVTVTDAEYDIFSATIA